MTRTKLVCLLLLGAATLSAQYNSGIEATIVDQLGSVISEARVIITNQDTGVAREITANVGGYFRVSDLPPGTYRVEVQSPGFEKYIQTNLQIAANQLRTHTNNQLTSRTVFQNTIPAFRRNEFGGVIGVRR